MRVERAEAEASEVSQEERITLRGMRAGALSN